MSDGTSIGGFFANFAFNLRGVALVEGAVKAVERLNAATARREKVQNALTTIYGDKNKAAELIGVSADAAAIAADRTARRTSKWGEIMLAVNQTLEVGMKIYRGVENGLRSVAGAVQAVSDQASQAVDTGQRLGMSASAVQELGYASQQSSGSVELMTLSLQGLSNKLDAAKHGSKDAARALREVGLDKSAAGKPLDETLGKIADRFQKMPDGAKKSALAMDLFGKAGSKMIPLLNAGSAGIGALREEAIKTGFVIDDKAAGALDGFGDQTDKLKAQLLGLRNQAIVALLPTLQRLVAGVQEWVTANRELLVGALTTALRVFLGVLQVVGKAVEVMVAVFGWLAEHSDVLIAALSGIGSVLAILGVAFVALKWEAIKSAVATAAAWLLAAWPLALIAIGIGLLVYAFLKLRGHVGGVLSWIGARFKDLGRLVAGFFRGIRDGASAVVNGIKDFFLGIFHWIAEKLQSAWDKVKQIANEAKNIALSPVRAAVGAAKSALKGIAGHFGVPEDKLMPGSAPATVPTVPANAGGNKTVTQTNHITVQAKGTDAKEVVALIDDRVGGLLRETGAAIG